MAAAPASVKVLVTGAAGQIGYALLPLIASGQMFGENQSVIIHCVEVPFPAVMQKLNGVLMEIQDCAYPLLAGIHGFSTDQPEEAWTDIDYAVLVGGFPRKQGMVRADLLKKNASIFKQAGECLEAYAKETTKVLVVANPANTNCYVASNFAPKIPKENFSAMSRLDFNRAKGLLGDRLKCNSNEIKNMVIWGNHSKSQVPDATFATANGESVKELVGDDDWLYGTEEEQFMHSVQYRGAAVIKERGASSAMSAANAAKDHVRDWHLGTTEGETVAMSVWSTGNPYEIEDELFYSFPCTCNGGEWAIDGNFVVESEPLKELMVASQEELKTEKATCMDFLTNPPDRKSVV